MGHCTNNNQVTDVPLSRYAEVLLNYAEVTAESEILTRSDLDNSINLIRDRVGLPHTVNAHIAEPIRMYESMDGNNSALYISNNRS